jgi:hypothetical protein
LCYSLNNNIIMNRTERALDQSGISVAPPMRFRAATQTIVPAPTHIPSTRIRKPEPSSTDSDSSEDDSSDSERSPHGEDAEQESHVNMSNADVGGKTRTRGGEVQTTENDGQIGDSEMERDDGAISGEVGYDVMEEDVGDGDMGDYSVGDHGMGYDEDIDDGAAQHVPGFSLDSDHASWPGDVGYDQHMLGPHAMNLDADTGALWKPRHGGAFYRTAAGWEQPAQPAHLQVPVTVGFRKHMDHEGIPLDTDAIVNYYGTSRKHKRGHSQADSVESRQSKVNRQSASHSSAAIQSTMVSTGAQSPSSAIPSTKVSTCPQSPSRDVSPVSGDFYGASRATGGMFRGRALGNTPNWADSKKSNAHNASSKPNGKVLLYTNHDQDAPPAMMIMHETVAQLPPILEKLSRKFSPIRSK